MVVLPLMTVPKADAESRTIVGSRMCIPTQNLEAAKTPIAQKTAVSCQWDGRHDIWWELHRELLPLACILVEEDYANVEWSSINKDFG